MKRCSESFISLSSQAFAQTPDCKPGHSHTLVSVKSQSSKTHQTQRSRAEAKIIDNHPILEVGPLEPLGNLFQFTGNIRLTTFLHTLGNKNETNLRSSAMNQFSKFQKFLQNLHRTSGGVLFKDKAYLDKLRLKCLYLSIR